MARPVGKSTPQHFNNATTATIILSGLGIVAGDLIVIPLAQDDGGTAISESSAYGWTVLNPGSVTGAARQAIAYKYSTTGTESNPTFTGTSGEAWSCLPIVIKDANPTTPVCGYASATFTTNPAASPALTTVAGDFDYGPVLLLYSWCFDGAVTYGRALSNELIELGKDAGDRTETISDATISSILGYRVQDSAGAVPSLNAYTSATGEGGNAWVLAIKNKNGGSVAADCRTGIIEPTSATTSLNWYGKFGSANKAVTWQAPSTNFSTAFGGIALFTSASGSIGFTNQNQGLRSNWGDYTQIVESVNLTTSFAGAQAWCGASHAMTSTDLSGMLLAVQWWAQGTFLNVLGTNGFIFAAKDALGVQAAWTLSPKAAIVQMREQASIIDLADGTKFASSGTIDLTQIVAAGFFHHRMPGYSVPVVFGVKNCCLIDKSIITGGGASVPASFAVLEDALSSWDFAGLADIRAGVQFMPFASVQIGDLIRETYFDASSQAFAYPDAYSLTDQPLWNVPTRRVGLTILSSPDDTPKLTACSLVTLTEQDLTYSPSSDIGAAYASSGASVVGPWNISLRPGFNNAGMSIKGGTINLAEAGTYEFLVAQNTTINFTPTGASTYVMGDCSITGTLDLRNTTLHAITVELPSGTTTDDTNNTGGAITVVTPTSNITFDDMIAGGTLKVFTTGTQTELFSDTNTATSEVWTGASGTFDYTWIKEGYLPIRATGEVVSGSRTITLQPVVDRAYATSSGLTFNTNLFYAPGTKLAGLMTVASTLQNLYSALIEAYRVESTLKNKPFPLAANGPNSFSWLDGNTFDLATYPNSITLLSRDGMRYLDVNGAATDVWAAILSVGVPAGFQVRFQQQDGLGTTNAQNTGNIDQLIKIKKTGTGAFDYTGWLVLKCQEEGYDQAEAIAADIYGTLEDQLYVFGLTPLPNGIAAGAVDATVTVTAEPTPVEWPAASGRFFSTTITDTTDSHSGLEIMQAVRAENEFNWSDLIRPNGSKFKTVTGNFYGDAYATPAGVRVVKADGVTPHPAFDLFNDDSGSDPYVPPVVAPIGWDGALDGTTVLLYNDVGGGAGVIIDTQTISGAGGYSLDVTLPSVDVAVGDPLRIRFGHKEYYAGELQGTMTATGLTFVGDMTLHPVYAAWGLDGSVYDQGYTPPGPFTMDGTHLQVDIAADSTTGLKTQLGAWTQHLMTIPAGLAAFYGAWDLLAVNQIRQNVDVVDVMIDVPTAGALFTFTDHNVNYYRSDFSYPGNVEAGHGLIAITYNASIFVPDPVIISGESVVTGTPDTVAAAVAALSAATPFAANVKKVNDTTIIGTGVPPTYANMPVPTDPGDPFRVA